MGGGITIVTIRPGVQFTPEAAAAFRRAEAQVQQEFGRGIDVNSTYRDWGLQLSMFNAWQAYVNGRGPYPGHSKALHPDDPLAFHTKGLALDSDDWVNARIVQILAENGFTRNRLYVPNENHHFEYIRSEDKNYGKPASGGNAAPASTPAEPEEAEDDMATAKNVMHHRDHQKYKYEVSISNPVSGFYLSYVTNDPGTNNEFAAQYETGGSKKVSDSMFRVIAQACAAVRPQTSMSVEVANADA